MTHSQKRRMTGERGFALVLALVLVAMLATTSVGLGMLVSTEAVRSASLSRDLDHKLAVDSLITLLPQLLAQEGAAPKPGSGDDQRVICSIGRVHVACTVRPEKLKQKLTEFPAGRGVAVRLGDLARSNGLPETSIAARPILETEETKEWPDFVWFDQIVAARGFEEVFHWRHSDQMQLAQPEKKVWSDLVTFWDAGARTRSLEVTTRVDADVRRWYLVVDLSEDDVRTLYRGAI